MTDQRLMEWFVRKNEQQVGPLTYDALLASIGDGSIKTTDLVWTAGFKDWMPAASVDGLFYPPSGPSIPPPISQAQATGLAHSAAVTSVHDILREDILERLIGSSPKRKVYYRRVFSQLIQGAKLDSASLADLDLKAARKALLNVGQGSRLDLLPFRKATTFNWASFLFNTHWLVWRVAYLRWAFFCMLILLIVGSAFYPRLTAASTAFAIYCGCYGNRFLLIQGLTELKLGKLRPKPTNVAAVSMTVLAMLLLSVAVSD